MRPVTPAFLARLAESHQAAIRVDVLRDGAVIETLTTVTAGNVTLDSAAASRGRLDATIIDPAGTLTPTDAEDLLAPYGNELQAYRGVTYPDASTELVSLGVFRIDTLDVQDTPEGLELRVGGLDRSARVIDARFETATQIAAGTNVASAISTLIAGAGLAVTELFDTTSHTTPLVNAEAGGERWQLCQQLATDAGLDLYFDGDGNLRLAAASLATDTPVAELAEGAGGVLLNAGRGWNRERAYNAVFATGERTGDTPPPSGSAVDDNPLSPTYYYGRFGRVPRFYASPLLTTSAQCADAARSILNRELGTTQQVSFGALVNPALEPGDVVTITRDRAGISEAHVIDSLTIPLAADQPMTGRTRAVQVTS
jgi:hypothetical protein